MNWPFINDEKSEAMVRAFEPLAIKQVTVTREQRIRWIEEEIRALSLELEELKEMEP